MPYKAENRMGGEREEGVNKAQDFFQKFLN